MAVPFSRQNCTPLLTGAPVQVHFGWMDAPAFEILVRALKILNYLGAIDDDGSLTPVRLGIDGSDCR